MYKYKLIGHYCDSEHGRSERIEIHIIGRNSLVNAVRRAHKVAREHSKQGRSFQLALVGVADIAARAKQDGDSSASEGSYIWETLPYDLNFKGRGYSYRFNKDLEGRLPNRLYYPPGCVYIQRVI